MAPHTALYQTIDTIVSDLLAVIEMMEDLPPMSGDALQVYKKRCSSIPEQIRSNRIKIAVAGVIKSGKSTLINAMIGKELVKRGAGVVTSITTRIRKGRKNRALVFLKSWDDINGILRNSLEMFPENDPKIQPVDIAGFDLRRKKDRAFLQQVYEKLVQDFPVIDQGIRPEILVIRNALEGYEACYPLVGADRGCMVFEAKQFENHKTFTGNPANAFYVKDVCLELFGKVLEPHVEIADCQGTDSTDPDQLHQILHYIQASNLIIYCISSRTGLRQSDLHFLKLIRRLGLLDNIVFVNNCDLSEHDTLKDLQAVENQTRRDLGLLTADPELFSFSALLELFCAMEKKLGRRDRKRLALWQEDTAMARYCKQNAKHFYRHFGALLAQHHHRLLISNHLERLYTMTLAMEKKALLYRQVLASDMDGRKKTEHHIGQIRTNAARLKSIVEPAISGAISGLTSEIDTHLENSFAKEPIHIRQKLHEFIRNASLDAGSYQNRVKELGFQKMLYLLFQDFKRDLDMFVIKHVLPDIKALVTENENRIETCCQSFLDSYQVDVEELIPAMEPQGEMRNDQALSKHRDIAMAVDVQAIKKILGLMLPKPAFSPHYSARMQAGAFTELGVSFFARLLSFLKDKRQFSFAPGLEAAANRIKKLSMAAVDQKIDLFHDRVRNQYFIPLIHAVTRDLTDKIHDRFLLYESLEADMTQLFDLRQNQKLAQQKKITTIITRLEQIRLEILRIK
ncbi:MAG: dynamin family protein [Desulfotignum sp.]|nr:dynamin family protein [Desulfobacteraceae bacterium]